MEEHLVVKNCQELFPFDIDRIRNKRLSDMMILDTVNLERIVEEWVNRRKIKINN